MSTEPYVKQDPQPHALLFSMPDRAIDSHMHVIGPFDFFPLSPKSKYRPFAATWQEQREILIEKMGFWGFVVVQATCHGTDNRVVVDALEHMSNRLRRAEFPVARGETSDFGFLTSILIDLISDISSQSPLQMSRFPVEGEFYHF